MAEIPKPTIELKGSTEANNYIQPLINQGILKNVDPARIKSMTGESSDCFFLVNDGQPLVAKFRPDGIDAEKETLEAWHSQGIATPTILAHGTITSTVANQHSTKYILMEGVVDKDGEPAITGARAIEKRPDLAKALGTHAGNALITMSQKRVDDLPFGGFADTWDHDRMFSTWNEFLISQLDLHEVHALSFVSQDTYSAVKALIPSLVFDKNGIYAHGDLGPHNMLVPDLDDPQKAVFIDPNPKIADPSWDIALQYIRINLLHEQLVSKVPLADTYESAQQYFDGFMSTLNRQGFPVDRRHVLASQIVRGLGIAKYQKEKIPGLQSADTRNAMLSEIGLRNNNVILDIEELLAA